MSIRETILIAVLTVGAVAPSLATETVVVTESWGSLLREVWGVSSPTPACWTDWERTPADEPVFHEVDLGTEDWLACGETWLVHCDADSLALYAAWDDPRPGEPDDGFFFFVQLTAELGCRIQVTENCRLTARRAHLGTMDTDAYGVTVTLPDQTEVVLLDMAGGPDSADLDLAPGDYTVVMTALARDDDRVPDYDLQLVVEFTAEEVPARASSWSTIRSLFH